MTADLSNRVALVHALNDAGVTCRRHGHAAAEVASVLPAGLDSAGSTSANQHPFTRYIYL